MYLKRGLKKTIQAVKEHKILFILLIVIQLIFLISCSYLIVTYQVKIMQNAQDITQALENANYDPNAIQLGGQFMKDISLVYDNYNNMMEFITQFILWIFGLFILFNGLIWLGAHYMLKKTAVIKVAVKFFVATLVMISPLLIIFYYILSKYVTALDSIWQSILILFVILYYFLLVSYAFINVKSWKSFVKKTFVMGIKKIHLTLLVLIINLILISLSGALIYFTVSQIYLSMLGVLLLVTFLILTKIFWISTLQDEKNYH